VFLLALLRRTSFHWPIPSVTNVQTWLSKVLMQKITRGIGTNIENFDASLTALRIARLG
jgi:hypothetical protein